jgi:hypothetical protein
MLDEGPEQSAVGLADDEITVDQDVSGRHPGISPFGWADRKAGRRTDLRVLPA